MFVVYRNSLVDRTLTTKPIASYNSRKIACDVTDFLNIKERRATTYYTVKARLT